VACAPNDGADLVDRVRWLASETASRVGPDQSGKLRVDPSIFGENLHEGECGSVGTMRAFGDLQFSCELMRWPQFQELFGRVGACPVDLVAQNRGEWCIRYP